MVQVTGVKTRNVFGYEPTITEILCGFLTTYNI